MDNAENDAVMAIIIIVLLFVFVMVIFGADGNAGAFRASGRAMAAWFENSRLSM